MRKLLTFSMLAALGGCDWPRTNFLDRVVPGYRRMIEGSVAKGPGRRTKSVPSARCSWVRTAVLSPAATS
jgi:hypothetical protein